MSLVLDHWPDLEAAVPTLAGRVDRSAVGVVGHSMDGSPHLTTAGPEWHVDPFRLAPAPKTLVTLVGAEHGLGGVSGYDVAETTDPSPERLRLVCRLVANYLGGHLRGGAPLDLAALESDALVGRVEVEQREF